MAEDGYTRVISDLRTPLTCVRSLSEILHDYPHLNGNKRREFLDIIIQQTERMSGIIKRAESPADLTPDSDRTSPNQQAKNHSKGGRT